MIAVVGKSGSGKTDFISLAVENFDYKQIPILTTDVIYTDQQYIYEKYIETGNQYVYLPKSEFVRCIDSNELAEYTFKNGNYYGTLLKDYMYKESIAEVSADSLKKIKSNNNIQCDSIYIIADKDVRIDRLKYQGLQMQEIVKKISDEDILFKDIEQYCDYCIENNESLSSYINLCANFLRSIL